MTARITSITWAAVLLGLLLLAAAYLWYPIVRAGGYAQVNYNEGWNSYRQQMSAQGMRLYALPPDYSATNYPPLSFHLVGFVGKLTGDMTAAGRWVSVASLAALMFFICALTHHFTSQLRLGIYAALCFGIWVEIYCPDRIGMNDPQFLGMAVCLLGFWIYACKPGLVWLCVSAVIFAIAIFIKHNLIALPAAASVHLLLQRHRQRLAIWTGTLAAACVALLWLSIQGDGPYFWAHILLPRSYSWRETSLNVSPYVVMFQIPVAASALWAIWAAGKPGARLLVLAFVMAHAIGFIFAGGGGVDRNVLLDGLLMVAILTAMAVGEVAPWTARFRFGQVLLPVALCLPLLGSAALLSERMHTDMLWFAHAPQVESETVQAVSILKSRSGPALCEDLLLCYEAGKPLLWDAFFVHEQVRVGRIAEADTTRMIANGTFRTIEIELAGDELLTPEDRIRFTAAQLRAIGEHYKPALRGSTFAVLVPKD